MINLGEYGVFAIGMTSEEIMDYLVARYNEDCVQSQKSKYVNKKRLYNKFTKIAGVNTQALITCPCCNKSVTLMYRHDIRRFADKLFLNKETYFD